MIHNIQNEREQLRITYSYEIEGKMYGKFITHIPLKTIPEDYVEELKKRHEDILNTPQESEEKEPLTDILVRYTKEEIDEALKDEKVSELLKPSLTTK